MTVKREQITPPENITYTIPHLPFYAVKQQLSWYPNMSADAHWHRDIEFLYALSGHITYHINGEEYMIEEGTAVFVNSGQFHFGYSADGTDCEFICIIIPLELFEHIPYVFTNYILPITEAPAPFCLLYGATDTEKELLSFLKKIYETVMDSKDGYELMLIGDVMSVWRLLRQLPQLHDFVHNSAFDKQIQALELMIVYISHHYSKKISLAELAKAGRICRSSCCRIFMDILHRTPVTYMNEYRIAQSLELLKENVSVMDAALSCGFPNISYFTKVFRQSIGCTPKEYQKNMRALKK